MLEAYFTECLRLILLGVGGLYYWVINDDITRNWLQISQY